MSSARCREAAAVRRRRRIWQSPAWRKSYWVNFAKNGDPNGGEVAQARALGRERSS
jgi:hypothetical protein